MPAVQEMFKMLRTGKIVLPPLSFDVLHAQPSIGANRRMDLMIKVSWRSATARFAVECKSISTPRAFQDGLNLLKTKPMPKGCLPMLILPYLNERQLQTLEQEGISGIDLCGNGVIVAPGVFAVFRGGEKNRFPSSAPIKNIYRKNSSMVGRVFLSRPVYETVQDVRSEINRRNLLVNSWNTPPMSLSTVSKVLKTLKEDLIVERDGIIRLLQADELLRNISDNYTAPRITERVKLKVPEGTEMIWSLLARQSQELRLPLVATGISSVGRYATMQRGDPLSVYCPCVEMLLERSIGDRTDRFPNVELVETEDETVYFDTRPEGDFRWASPVQAYVELMAGDKRDQETAGQVKSFIMAQLQKAKP